MRLPKALSSLAVLGLALGAVSGDFIAVLKGTVHSSQANGTVIIFDNGEIIQATVSVCGVTANTTHGVHIHDFGDLSSTDGTAAGGHFNPEQVEHGCTGTRHIGDLGNLEIGVDGCGTRTFTMFLDTMTPGARYVLGRGVIVHERVDDCSQPVGNAGSRYLQGVIGIRQNTNLDLTGASTPLAHAVAVLAPTAQTDLPLRGTVLLDQQDEGVNLRFYLTGLAPSTVYSIHIHAFGDVSDEVSGNFVGGHFNPYGENHGCTGPRHAGDMGKFTSSSSGVLSVTYLNTNVSLSQDTINSILGRAIVIHGGEDDCTSNPAGNSGPRIAQGVIGVANTRAATPVAISTLSPTTGNTASGSVVFTVVNSGGLTGLNAHVSINGLAAESEHGIHIHQFGDLTKGDGTGAGGHYNPNSVSHACTGQRHVGDLGNVKADANGNVETDIFTEMAGLDPESAQKFIIGRGLILHGSKDDCTTQPTGNAGARLLQGVIGYRSGSISPAGTGDSTSPDVQAVCTMRGTTGNTISGNITITPRDEGGVSVYFYLEGFSANGEYAIHIHEFGDISLGNGTASGAHFNPGGAPHACAPTANRHVGDMGNFKADAAGKIMALFNNGLATLRHNNAGSVLGRAIVIHSGKDDCSTQPTGNAGGRIAHCVIGYTDKALRYDPTPCQENCDGEGDGDDAASALLPSALGTALVAASLFLARHF